MQGHLAGSRLDITIVPETPSKSPVPPFTATVVGIDPTASVNDPKPSGPCHVMIPV